ncbi:exodeoxyribonuclease VII small subunit [Gammaproteobacteria bacterium]|nr:exodeoxyribonuclease VII small subunit [Gammaproteobacteria bacterium]
MKKQEKKTYAQIIEELELVISKLNATNIPIENSIQLYEEGINLTNEADKELTLVEKNFDKIKKNKKNQADAINIEKSFDEIEYIIGELEAEDITIEKVQEYYENALQIIFDIESYLKRAKTTIKKYEQ